MALARLIKSRRQRGSRQAAVSRLYEHLWHLEHDLLGPGEQSAERAIFTRNGERVSRERAMEAILHQPAAEARYHQLVFAFPATNGLEARTLTRTLLDYLAERLGIALCWVAVVHRNRELAHAHVILAGAGKSADGMPQPALLGREEWTWLHHGVNVSDPFLKIEAGELGNVQAPHQVWSTQPGQAHPVTPGV
jgi:hypothetical protein